MVLSKKELVPSSRIVTLGEITNESAGYVIENIYQINEEDELSPDSTRLPIKLILNSSGGDVYDGMGIIDTIEQSITPVHIIVQGHAQSMGFAIASVGHYRMAGKRATFMYHELSWETSYEKLQHYEQEVKESKRLWELYNNIIVTNTKITLSTLQQIQKERRDWYLTAKEALKLGIIDKII